jgi:hypothetical protein
MKVELKAIKHCKELSRETLAFVGKLYINGKHIADAENDGHGACTNLQVKWSGKKDDKGYPIYSKKDQESLDAFYKWGEENSKYGAEQIVDDLVVNDLHWKSFQSLKRRELVYWKPNVGKYGGIFTAGKRNSAEYQEALTRVSWWKPEYEVLNPVSKDEFMDKYLESWIN